MLPRLIAVLIVAFWGTMWALLIRTEMRPEGAALREVPLEHVMKLIFQHGKRSDLAIQNGSARLGSLHLTPRTREGDERRLLDFMGSIEVQTPRQRLSWDGLVELTPGLDLALFRLGTNVRDPAKPNAPSDRFELQVDPAIRRARWRWMSLDRLLDERAYTLDEAGLRAALAELNLDPSLLPTVQTAALQAAPPRITAHLSSLRIRDEWAETFLITIEHGGQTWLECHISQLGEVLHARTLVGWTLWPD